MYHHETHVNKCWINLAWWCYCCPSPSLQEWQKSSRHSEHMQSTCWENQGKRSFQNSPVGCPHTLSQPHTIIYRDTPEKSHISLRMQNILNISCLIVCKSCAISLHGCFCNLRMCLTCTFVEFAGLCNVPFAQPGPLTDRWPGSIDIISGQNGV